MALKNQNKPITNPATRQVVHPKDVDRIRTMASPRMEPNPLHRRLQMSAIALSSLGVCLMIAGMLIVSASGAPPVAGGAFTFTQHIEHIAAMVTEFSGILSGLLSLPLARWMSTVPEMVLNDQAPYVIDAAIANPSDEDLLNDLNLSMALAPLPKIDSLPGNGASNAYQLLRQAAQREGVPFYGTFVIDIPPEVPHDDSVNTPLLSAQDDPVPALEPSSSVLRL